MNQTELHTIFNNYCDRKDIGNAKLGATTNFAIITEDDPKEFDNFNELLRYITQ